MNVEIIKEKIAARTELGLTADQYLVHLRDQVRDAARRVHGLERQHIQVVMQRLPETMIDKMLDDIKVARCEYDAAWELAERHGALIHRGRHTGDDLGCPSRELDPGQYGTERR